MFLCMRETVEGLSSTTVRSLSLAGAAAAALMTVASGANALVITPFYDTSVTSSPYSAQIKAAFQIVANEYMSAYSTPITLKIAVGIETRPRPTA